MSQTNPKYENLNQHLISNIPNIEEFRDFIKQVNKMARKSNSIWQLGIKYRKPKEGHKYGYGGNLKCKNANAFSVYVRDRRPYSEIPSNQYSSELWGKNRKLQEENESLKKKIAILENPYMHWSLGDIEDELFDVKEDCIDRFVESVEDVGLRDKYNLLTEAQTIKEGECNA